MPAEVQAPPQEAEAAEQPAEIHTQAALPARAVVQEPQAASAHPTQGSVIVSLPEWRGHEIAR